MKYKKIIILTIITIFTIGMIIGTANAATHKVTKGKYTVKLTNNEYKQLNTYETKYETVTKTRNVTKYKEVEKERRINITETETGSTTAYIFKDQFTNYNNETGHYEYQNLTCNNTERASKFFIDQGYVLTSSNVTYYPEPKHMAGFTVCDDNRHYYNRIGDIQLCFEKNTTKATFERYNETVPYNVTEKYTEKIPYKTRKIVTITKKIPGKYLYVKKAVPIVKTVKVPKIIGKYQYIGKTYIFGIQTNKLIKNTQKRIKTLRKAGWKINKNKYKSILGEDRLFYHYFYCTKKIYVKQKKVVANKYIKVKKPLIMTITTLTQNEPPKGKVYVSIWCNGDLKAHGYVNIK